MKLTVISPESQSLRQINTAIKENDTIYRSPHVGNVNANELRLLLGLSNSGATVQLQMVDTIRGDDRYANPRVALVGGTSIALASRNYAQSRIVGASIVSVDGLSKLSNFGIGFTDPADAATLKTLHLSAMRQVLPERTTMNASSAYFATAGTLAYEAMLQSTARILSRPLRTIDCEGKIRQIDELPKGELDIYGLGANPMSGLLPSLEGMMAMEVVTKVMATQGADARIVHVAGPDMIRYTKLEDVMKPVETIANSVLKELGIGSDAQVEYVVPCMRTLLESKQFCNPVLNGVESQYDLLAARQLVESIS